MEVGGHSWGGSAVLSEWRCLSCGCYGFGSRSAGVLFPLLNWLFRIASRVKWTAEGVFLMTWYYLQFFSFNLFSQRTLSDCLLFPWPNATQRENRDSPPYSSVWYTVAVCSIEWIANSLRCWNGRTVIKHMEGGILRDGEESSKLLRQRLRRLRWTGYVWSWIWSGGCGLVLHREDFNEEAKSH